MKLALSLLIVFFSFNSFCQEGNDGSTKLITFYQKYISDIRGGSCPMYPSCSQYGLEVFEEDGSLKGFLSVPDRLMRCGHERKYYSYTLREAGFKLLDHYDQSRNANLVFSNRKFWPFSDSIVNQTTQEKLIKDLIEKSFYSEALIEIRRFFLSDNSVSVEVYLNYLIVLHALENQELAIYEFEVVFPESIKRNRNILLKMAEISRSLNNYELESKYLNNLLPDSPNDKITYLKTVSFAMQKNFSKSYSTLESLQPQESYEIRNAVEEYENLKFKKEWKGAIGNVVPGLGYLYSGHSSTALSAFLLNSILMYATYSNFKNDNKGMGILSGVFAVSFYFSGISGGSKSVRRYNQHQEKLQKEKLKLFTK